MFNKNIKSEQEIVFKTNSFPNVSETFIVSNIKESIDAGFNINIIINDVNPKDYTSQSDLLTQYGLLEKIHKLEQPRGKIYRKVKAIYLLLNPFLFYYFIKYFFYKKRKTLDYLFLLSFYWKYRKVKAYHVHFATAVNPLFELKEIGFLKSKIIVTFHGYDAHFSPNKLALNDLITNFNKWVSVITVNSQFLKNKLVEKGFEAANIRIIPIGIDTDFFNNSIERNVQREVFKIITVGRFIELKGQEFGIKAIKILKNKGYNIDYTLIGIGEKWDQLKELVIELNLTDTVHFLGVKNQIEIKELLQKSDLFLMTSTCDMFNRQEAFGVVSLEAQAMGLPVVGFKSGGFPETLIEGKTGITVKDKDIESLVDAIVTLIENKNKLKEMSNQARKNIRENFDIKNMMGQYLELYS